MRVFWVVWLEDGNAESGVRQCLRRRDWCGLTMIICEERRWDVNCEYAKGGIESGGMIAIRVIQLI